MTVDGPPAFRYCPLCGAAMELIDGTRHTRCVSCRFVHYRNPAAGVAVVVRDEAGGVLMGERARGDYAGLWCIPCGYVEWDEDIRDAAVREFEEETGLVVTPGEVVAVHSNFHNPRQHTVGTWFAGRVTGGTLEPRDGELSRLAYVDPAHPPPLAFPTDALVLQQLSQESPQASPGAESPGAQVGHPGQ